MADFDIKNIEKMIGERKKEIQQKGVALGEAVGITTPVDNELHELVNAIQTRNPNSKVVKKMKVVEHRSKNVDVKTGINNNTPLDENTLKHITSAKPQTTKTPLIHENVGPAGGMKNDLASQDRGDKMWNNFNTGGGSGNIYDTMAQYNKSGVVNEYNNGMATGGGGGGGSMMGGVNPQIINEQIGNHTVAFINEHFVNLADQALKNHIVEQYAVERVKKVLEEQMRPVIQKMVIETIREIQKNNQKSAK